MSWHGLVPTVNQDQNVSWHIGMDSSRTFKWALLVVECMKELRTEGFGFVDQEVVPNFNSTPNGISAWFICEHNHASGQFDLRAATEALKNKLRGRDFPQDGLETLETSVTSQAEIKPGGGRFYSSAERTIAWWIRRCRRYVAALRAITFRLAGYTWTFPAS
jgi:hypothetical protein